MISKIEKNRIKNIIYKELGYSGEDSLLNIIINETAISCDKKWGVPLKKLVETYDRIPKWHIEALLSEAEEKEDGK